MLVKNSMFSAEMIHGQVNDLLDLAKIQEGKFSFNLDYFDFMEMIQNSINQV